MGSGRWCGPRWARALEAAGFDCAHRMVVDVLLSYITHIGRSTAFNTNLAGHALTNEDGNGPRSPIPRGEFLH
jgi:hypothetical protein